MYRKHARPLAICAAILFCLVATQALAKDLVVTNKTSKTISLAICYKDAVANEWMVRGWFNIDPVSKKTISLNTDNGLIYLHGEAGKFMWGCKGQDSSRTFNVVSSKFFYKKDKERPKGDNVRGASFCMTKIKDNGQFRFDFVD